MKLDFYSKSYPLAIDQRKTLCESIYIDHLKTTVRLLTALPNDLPLILDYFQHEHFNESKS